MTMWRPDLDGTPGPKYLLIAKAIGESIADGSLTERDRLPAQRDLAYWLCQTNANQVEIVIPGCR